MGMNIHLIAPKGIKFPLPACAEGSATLPRYSDGGEFMHMLWHGDVVSINRCTHALSCAENWCLGDGGDRPSSPEAFAILREKIKSLVNQQIYEELLDYLEAHPDVHLQYD